MPDRTGQQLGNYRLIRRIDEDAVTETYLGGAQTGAQVTFKTSKYLSDQARTAQFLTEASRIAQLNHPNIVRILAYGEADSGVYLTLDYASQATLRQIYPRGQQLELSQVIRFTRQITEALQYIHDRRIIHGDLRPENLLPGPQQTILLSNFSLPVLHAELSGGAITPYMAPEQARGEIRPASDQYALGVIVYEWLSGALPSANGQAAMPLSIQVQQVSTDIERVIMRTLERDWRARFESIRDFSQALEQATTSTFIGHAPVSLSASASAPSYPAVPPTMVAFSPQSVSPENSAIPEPQSSPPNFAYANLSVAPPWPAAVSTANSGPMSGPYADLPGPAIQYPIYSSPPAVVPIYVSAPQPPRKMIHFPLTRKAPIYLQIFGGLLYSVVLALCIMGSVLYLIKSYIPGSTAPVYTNQDGSANILAIILTIALAVLIVPACSILCGALFGSWRGLLVSVCSVGGGVLITHLSYPQFWANSTLPNLLALAPFPVTAFFIGLIYDRRKFAAWWKSMFTVMLGWAIIIVWFFGYYVVAGLNGSNLIGSSTSADATAGLGAASVLLGCLSLLLIVILTFPIAIVEGIIHSIVSALKKKA